MKVVNYERLERLKPPPFTDIPMDLNTLSIVIMLIVALILFRRRRERFRT
jgi:hypothetical protein